MLPAEWSVCYHESSTPTNSASCFSALAFVVQSTRALRTVTPHFFGFPPTMPPHPLHLATLLEHPVSLRVIFRHLLHNPSRQHSHVPPLSLPSAREISWAGHMQNHEVLGAVGNEHRQGTHSPREAARGVRPVRPHRHVVKPGLLVPSLRTFVFHDCVQDRTSFP